MRQLPLYETEVPATGPAGTVVAFQPHAWADRSHDPHWYRFVAQADPRQLELFGFPPPGHAFWTDETLTGVGQRYPGLDMSPWLTAHSRRL